MHNNEVTYDKKWDTENNKALRKKVLDFLGPRSGCVCDVPAAWAQEVSWLISWMNSKFGIRYELSTHFGYFVDRNFFKLLFVNPWMSLTHNYSRIPEHLKRYRTRKVWYKAFAKNISSAYSELKHSLKIIKRQIVGRLHNWRKDPTITISQVKEKFGSLRIYYSINDPVNQKSIEEDIEFHIKSAEIMLSQKGAYYSIDQMYDWASTTYNGDTPVKKYPYREFIDTIRRNKDTKWN